MKQEISLEDMNNELSNLLNLQAESFSKTRLTEILKLRKEIMNIKATIKPFRSDANQLAIKMINKSMVFLLLILSFSAFSQPIFSGKKIHQLSAIQTSQYDSHWLTIIGSPYTGTLYKLPLDSFIVTGSDTSNIINSRLAYMPPFTIKGNPLSTNEKPVDINVSGIRQLIGISDVGISGYYTDLMMKPAIPDSVLIYNAISLKLNKSDTSGMSHRIDQKQNILVSGSTLKTINGNSLLGFGDLSISGSGGSQTIILNDSLIDSYPNQYVYQLDNSADVTISSNQLARWNEKLGSGKDIIIASSRPTYYANGQNAKPYVTGSNISLSTFPVASSPATMYFILRTPTIIEETPFIHWGNIGGADGVRYSSSGVLGQFAMVYTGVSPYYSNTNYNVPRTDWMLITVKFKDDNSFLIEVNNELMGVGQLDQAGGSVYNFGLLNLSYYSGLQVSEFRIFSRLTSQQEDDNIKSYFISKYNIQSNRNKDILIFGDSHSVGIQSGSPIGTPYPSLLHTQTGLGVISYSGSGNTVESLLQGSALLNNYQIANKKENKDYYVLFNLGTNDAATAAYSYGWQDWSRWKDDYKSYILSFINNGFDRAKIIIATPPYSTGSYVNGQLGNVRSKILEIADELKIKLADWYDLMLKAGIDANTMGGDGIHVNDPSHALLFNKINSIYNLGVSGQTFDQTLNFGNTTDTLLSFDSRNTNYTFLEVKPIKSSQPKQVKLSFIRSATAQAGGIPDNEVYVSGFNLNGGGGKIDPLQPSIGESWESGYFPLDDSSRFVEKHEIYYPNNATGGQIRLSSYTINAGSNSGTGEGWVDYYNTVHNHYYKNPTNQNVWLTMQPRKFTMANDNGSLDNVTFTMDTVVNTFTISNQGAGDIRTFVIDGFDAINFGNPATITGLNISSSKSNSFLLNSSTHNYPYAGLEYAQNVGNDQVKFSMYSHDGPYIIHKLLAYGGLYPTYSVEGSGTSDMLFASFTNLKILMPVAFANANPDPSAQVDIPSTTKGFLPPRMTATQASEISSPAEGLMVYVTNTNGTFTAKGWWGYDGSAWQKLNN